MVTLWRKTMVFVHTFWGRKLLILSTFTVVFHPRIGFSSTPLRLVLVCPTKPEESFKEANKYKCLQQIVVFCSKTDTVAQFPKWVFRLPTRQNVKPAFWHVGGHQATPPADQY